MNITISTEVFVAVSLFRGIDDVRYYLNGLYLETGVYGARLVGCDGHQLAVAKLDGGYPDSSIILPGSLVATIKSKAKAPQQVMLSFNDGHQQHKKKGNAEGVFVPRDIKLTFGEITTSSEELDGKFPDFRRVVPSDVNGATAQFDPRLINRIDKACAILGCKSFVGIAHNGTSSGLSVINESFLVVTMPLDAVPNNISPAWAKASVYEQAPVRLAA